ncbi:GMC family oxidoreductase [Ralstonia sp.]|uniref:GMC family oxidoreductase n=1 Tax=Ralstonia sp. TaxID=54061 RepID=UPI002D0B1052|nr:GMC family oxidoreductase N-terminal domain-containing protein [Ralstonia sp.]HWV06828.1 GMC family oxidoreductase N-terminal domain-containing protein [Ralstonia sp.]
MATESQTSALTFDYVIVGAGSAGCALASRLTEDPDVTVALLEAGPHDHHLSVWVPAGCAASLPFKNKRNYGFQTVPQAGLGGRQGYQPRGRGLGGSSSLNAMIYIRGTPSDYNHWAALGCTGWGWGDVLPYFKRSEGNERFTGRDDDALHGGTGPLHVSDLRTGNPIAQRFVDAGVAAGYRRNNDFNGPDQEGVGSYQVTQYNGERWNAARAYLHGGDKADATFSRNRRQLTVMPDTQALRIVFEGKRAAGVTVERGGRTETLRARREVIVSSGAFGSPQLLMASGVGPAEHLRSLGIPVVHDLPGVGQNLQDHLDIILHKKVFNLDLIGYSARGSVHMLGEILRYRRERRGMLATNFAEAGGFIKSRPDLADPDLQLHFVVAMADNHNRTFNYGHGYSCHVCVLRPKSRGEVRLASADTREAPLIDPRFLSDPDDMNGMLAGFRAVKSIFAQRPLADLGGRELYSGNIRGDGSDDEAVRALIRQHADTIYHPVGTCKMGSADDAMAVVDPELRVRGLTGLRVIDGSVMPTLIGGNTNAPIIMIAERASDLMRQGGRPTLNVVSSIPAQAAPAEVH